MRGLDITYDAAKGTLTCGRVAAPLKPRDGRVSLRVLVDRGSVELFADGGAVAISVAHIAPDDDHMITAIGRGAIDHLVWWPIKSVWK